MNGAIALTTVFLTVALGALAGAMARATALDWPQWFFAAFFILFRVKMFLDDLAYLKKGNKRDFWFKLGFLVGIASWFFWLLSALKVEYLASALKFGLVAVFLSTFWVLIEGVRERFRSLHTFWLGVNVFYLASGWVALRGGASPPNLGWLFALWLGICLLDLFVSKSWDALPE
jgi:hypothetical protein